jgi:hypothetical protein
MVYRATPMARINFFLFVRTRTRPLIPNKKNPAEGYTIFLNRLDFSKVDV